MSGRDPIPQPQAYEGVRATNPPDLIISKGTNARNPGVNDHKYRIGTLWNNQLLNTVWMLTSIANSLAVWTELDNSGGSGSFTNITASGTLGVTGLSTLGALTQVGTTNLNTTGTAVTNIGNVTGNTVVTGAMSVSGVSTLTGGINTAPTVVAAGASPLTSNNRTGQVTFSGVSIASGASQAFVINNSTITGAGTVILYGWFGATAGSALSIQSVVNGAGISTITMTNGTSATMVTDVANITFVYEVLN